MKNKAIAPLVPAVTSMVHVAERGVRSPTSARRCEIETNVQFSTGSLESYFFAGWNADAYDAMLVAAAVEFADRTTRRAAHSWPRYLRLKIPVHDPARWNGREVADSLHEALTFLTGDRWRIEFYARRRDAAPARQGLLSIPPGIEAVIPFSNGMDSRAVAGLIEREMGGRVARIRLGVKLSDTKALRRDRKAFTLVPYTVKIPKGLSVESSVRSRGFKFALISGLAAYLAGAQRIVVPESGQGSIGPSLVTVGQAYEDYRSHPLFTVKMERFLEALLGHRVHYVFPQIWQTKGETLRRFHVECRDSSWVETWSCWRQNRHVSVEGKRRQCGVCAACMLRRMSIHAAGLEEPRNQYVWEDLLASSFEKGAARAYRDKGKVSRAAREYAIAGTLHMDHLGDLLRSTGYGAGLNLAAFQLARALGMSDAEARARLQRLLRQHREEWRAFVASLGPKSFVTQWTSGGRE